ncbi:unnamed protein product [Ceratitis capitata]|uniref:(Mediterranean fruit fly) hypothetical protein n=1 Tax=Ceratitis capitata TaxID=7213 RepID=A0A811TW08_CERCA|nr:unnamed protein product [Ceratitis capitata]
MRKLCCLPLSSSLFVYTGQSLIKLTYIDDGKHAARQGGRGNCECEDEKQVTAKSPIAADNNNRDWTNPNGDETAERCDFGHWGECEI